MSTKPQHNKNNIPSWFKWWPLYWVSLSFFIATVVCLVLVFATAFSVTDETAAWISLPAVFFYIFLLAGIGVNIALAIMIILMACNTDYQETTKYEWGGILAAGILTFFFSIICSTVVFCLACSDAKNQNKN